MSRTVAEVLIDTLADAGVQRIYGIVGDSLNPVTDAIRRSDKVSGRMSAMKRRRLSRPVRRPSSPANWRFARAVAAQAICI